MKNKIIGFVIAFVTFIVCAALVANAQYPLQEVGGGTATAATSTAGEVLISTGGQTYTPAFITCVSGCAVTSASGSIQLSGAITSSSAVTSGYYPFWASASGLNGSSSIEALGTGNTSTAILYNLSVGTSTTSTATVYASAPNAGGSTFGSYPLPTSSITIVNTTPATSGQEQGVTEKFIGQGWTGTTTVPDTLEFSLDPNTNNDPSFSVSLLNNGSYQNILSVDSFGHWLVPYENQAYNAGQSAVMAIQLGNDAPATLSTQQYSGFIEQYGRGWSTSAAASQAMSIGQIVETATGTTNPIGSLVWFDGTNNTTPSLSNELFRLNWGNSLGAVFNASSTAGYQVTVNGSTTLSGPLTQSGAVNSLASTTVNGNATATTLGITSSSYFGGNENVSGTLAVGSDTAIGTTTIPSGAILTVGTATAIFQVSETRTLILNNNLVDKNGNAYQTSTPGTYLGLTAGGQTTVSSTLASTSVTFPLPATTTKPWSLERAFSQSAHTLVDLSCFEYGPATTTVVLYYTTSTATSSILSGDMIASSTVCGVAGTSSPATNFTTSSWPANSSLWVSASSTTAGATDEVWFVVDATKI